MNVYRNLDFDATGREPKELGFLLVVGATALVREGSRAQALGFKKGSDGFSALM